METSLYSGGGEGGHVVTYVDVNVSKALIFRRSPRRSSGGAKAHWLSRVRLEKYDLHVGTGGAGYWDPNRSAALLDLIVSFNFNVMEIYNVYYII